VFVSGGLGRVAPGNLSPMIDLRFEDDLAVLRLEHGKANALDLELFEAIVVALDDVEARGAAAVVLTGTGKSFSAGLELFRVVDGGPAYLEALLPALDRAVLRLLTFPRPVVAAVNGHAIAGGCLVAMACDWRLGLAGGGAKLGVPELVVGVTFPSLPFELLRATVPPGLFAPLVYRGRLLSHEEALAAGLLHELAAPEELEAAARTAARDLAQRPRAAFALTKELERAPLLAAWQATRTQDPRILDLWNDPATTATIRAYLERTLGRSR
jgi:enoyl-CoA hydratase